MFARGSGGGKSVAAEIPPARVLAEGRVSD